MLTSQNIELDHNLREREFGALKDVSPDKWSTVPGYLTNIKKGVQKPDPTYRPKGGESLVDVQNRAVPVVKRLIEQHPGKNIVVVAHGHTIRALSAHFNNDWHKGKRVENAEIRAFDIAEALIEGTDTLGSFFGYEDSLIEMSYDEFELDPKSKAQLLKLIPAKYTKVVASHVTHNPSVKKGAERPTPPRKIEVIGHGHDEELGVQAAFLRVDGQTTRPDRQRYHVTISLDPEKARPEQANDIRKYKSAKRPYLKLRTRNQRYD